MAKKYDEAEFLEQLIWHMPVKCSPLTLSLTSSPGLVIVDEVNGFCTVGMGNLAPQQQNAQIESMVEKTNALAQEFSNRGWPILAFMDTHEKDKPEPPYPPHCVRGTGEELLVSSLEWLREDPSAMLMEKDCIDGLVGGIRLEDGSNKVVDWILGNALDTLLVVGICTDVCVMDFVLTTLSARNHGLLGELKDVLVLSEACATYTLPREQAESLGMPPHVAHPQRATHHLGLYFMQSRGAVIVDQLSFPKEDDVEDV
eukprot:TRINITY_DN12231_c0_g1_i1.p1 TRINITY_DN12231_c0_g1~~TRINITY_DN12231_c0_g1_i1.p1  ORF type:complete len:257 (+),score=41.71 TRINITY_DN12231_c0_g1_i1:331-1101(+)